MAIHSFHRFIHNQTLGMYGVNTAFTDCRGPHLWITRGWYGCAINNPVGYQSEMHCPAKHPQITPSGSPVPARSALLRHAVTQCVFQPECEGL